MEFELKRLGWRYEDRYRRFPEGDSVRGRYATREEAEAALEDAERKRYRDLLMSPQRFDFIEDYAEVLSNEADPDMVAWLQANGLKRDDASGTRALRPLLDDEVDAVRARFGVRFHEIVEAGPDQATTLSLWVVLQGGWSFNDEYYYRDAGTEPVAAWRSEQAARAEWLRLERDMWRWALSEGLVSLTGDPEQHLRKELAPAEFRARLSELGIFGDEMKLGGKPGDEVVDAVRECFSFTFLELRRIDVPAESVVS